MLRCKQVNHTRDGAPSEWPCSAAFVLLPVSQTHILEFIKRAVDSMLPALLTRRCIAAASRMPRRRMSRSGIHGTNAKLGGRGIDASGPIRPANIGGDAHLLDQTVPRLCCPDMREAEPVEVPVHLPGWRLHPIQLVHTLLATDQPTGRIVRYNHCSDAANYRIALSRWLTAVPRAGLEPEGQPIRAARVKLHTHTPARLSHTRDRLPLSFVPVLLNNDKYEMAVRLHSAKPFLDEGACLRHPFRVTRCGTMNVARFRNHKGRRLDRAVCARFAEVKSQRRCPPCGNLFRVFETPHTRRIRHSASGRMAANPMLEHPCDAQAFKPDQSRRAGMSGATASWQFRSQVCAEAGSDR